MAKRAPVRPALGWVFYAAICLALNSLFVFEQTSLFARNGSDEILGLTMLLELPAGIMFLMLPVALIALLFKRWRKQAVRPLLVTSIYVGIAVSCMMFGAKVRRDGFRHVAQRAAPLIQAIENFEKANGHPPASLDEVVPKFLPVIPDTGSGVAPRYIYRTGVDEHGRRVEDIYHGNGWVLQVFISDLLTDWRGIVYYPRQNYSAYPAERQFGQVANWIVVDGPLAETLPQDGNAGDDPRALNARPVP